MAQQNWTYADHVGHHYNIGLYHGTKTGHVIVYCDKNILIIDFSIRQNKRYSFYIGEQFFELDLKKEETQELFHYELKINNAIRVPLDRIKQKLQRRYNLISVGLGVLFFTGLFATTYLLVNMNMLF